MQPVSNIKELVAQLTATFSTQDSHCPTSVCLVMDDEVPSNSALSSPSMTWTDRGHYHLNRGEIDIAVDSFTKALQEAEKQNDRELMSDSLKNLGRAFLEKEQWVLAAKIFNAALALLYASLNHKARQTLLALMAELERRYLEKICGIRSNIDPSHYIVRRITLHTNRENSKSKVQKGEPVQNILSQLTQSNASLLIEMIQKAFTLFGAPPCDYTLLCLGSFARKEMSPYSDLEFAFLVEKSSLKELDYFRKLVSWLELQVIHLGETSIPILEQGRISPVQRGFSFDEGGNTPLGKQGYVELIKTPEELAQFQSERFYQEDLVLSNVLRGADFVMGSQTLYQQYLKAMQALLQEKSPTSPLLVCQKRALHLIKGHLVEFEPRVDRKKEETPVYNIKQELYRLPSFLIGALADYFGISEQNTWKKIDALVELKILSQEGAQHLQRALAAIMSLRIRCHLHYGEEREDVFHPAMQFKGMLPKQRFILSDDDINQIIEIYRVIFPLHRIFTQACQAGNFAALAKEIFFDNSLHAQAEAYAKLQQYDAAKKCYEKSVALNPEDPEALLQLAQLLWELAENSKAQEYVNKVLNFDLKQHIKAVSIAHNMQGLILIGNGDAKTAILHFKQSLELSRQVYGIEHPRISALYNNLGTAWQELGHTKEAIRYYEASLRISKKVYGEEHPTVAAHQCNLGSAWLDSGNAEKALATFQDCLRIAKKAHGPEHPVVATILSHLGKAWLTVEDAKKANECHEEGSRIVKKIYGGEHPHVANFLGNLGDVYHTLGNFKKARDYYLESLRILKMVYGSEHPVVANYLNNLGLVWDELNETKQAMLCLDEALKIARKIYGDKHYSVANYLTNLGSVWQARGNFNKARGYAEESLQITTIIFGNEHPHVAIKLHNLGTIWKAFGQAKRAIAYFEQALKMSQKTLGIEHSQVAVSLNNLGSAWLELGDAKKALTLHEEALRIHRKIYGDEHPRVAEDRDNVGNTHQILGNPSLAIIYFEESLRVRKKIYGEEHPALVPSLCGLCGSLRVLGNYKKAIGYCHKALQIVKKHHGNEHPEVATVLNELGGVLSSTGDVKKAIGCYEEALNIQTRIFGEEHPEVAKNLNNLGFALHASSDSKKAIEHFEKGLNMGKKIYGDQHPFIATCLNNLGMAWKDLKERNKAVKYFEESLEMVERIYGKDHPEVATRLNNLGFAWKELGDKKKAIFYFEQALEIFTRAYGADHPQVNTIKGTIVILDVCAIM
ncbi:MAG: tetratricopeptide repeat protein [Parachlamydia sp.]|nr:tetratricopeptide repeat protein [Parachlamydia sp.]